MISRIFVLCLALVGCDDPFRQYLDPRGHLRIDPAFVLSERLVIFRAAGEWAYQTDGCVTLSEADDGLPIHRRDVAERTTARTEYWPAFLVYLDPGLSGDRGTHTVMHELGHAFGLEHVGTPGAVMYPSGSTTTTLDDQELDTFYGLWEGAYEECIRP